MRRKCASDIRLRGRRHRAHDELGPVHGLADVGSDQAGTRLVPAAEVLDGDDAAGGAMCLDSLAVAPPQAHVVAGKGEVTGRRE